MRALVHRQLRSLAFFVLLSAGVTPLGCVGVNVDRATRSSGGTSSPDEGDDSGTYGAMSSVSTKAGKGGAGSTSRSTSRDGASAGNAGRAASATAGNAGTALAGGGVASSGGTQAESSLASTVTAGSPTVGGTSATGGTPNSAGSSSAVAGTSGSGGAGATAGSPSTAGTASFAGSAGAAGASAIDDPDVCDDESNVRAVLTGPYGRAIVTLTNNSNKSYVAMTNWWNKFVDQTMSVQGLGFSVTNTADAGPGAAPVGFPAFYIGDYQGSASSGSNLPLQVSKIRSIPTVFETNATSLDNSNFDAIYDVWFTSGGAALSSTATDPGASGLMLSIWLYMPSNRQPRGMKTAPTHAVAGAAGAWDVWRDAGTASSSPALAYVATEPQSSLAVDLNKFIQDAVSNHYNLTKDMYLSVIFGGFEIWGGANSAQLKRFCVRVNPV